VYSVCSRPRGGGGERVPGGRERERYEHGTASCAVLLPSRTTRRSARQLGVSTGARRTRCWRTTDVDDEEPDDVVSSSSSTLIYGRRQMNHYQTYAVYTSLDVQKDDSVLECAVDKALVV